ncbi:uncharacterized protein BKCO1_4800058 [Diplodia corticola]|uniref:Integral membrane protein n=1 Tax=Diplodia corticola TaxID=236234 RepID=A0A1J9RSL1_9PEZI|nr:uncharacterized protein BKCO1_4800058 [Diplodia corticola]OJD31431.1 integral membrane protein [Diplodia corticola]
MGGGLSPPRALLIEWATNRDKYPYGERRGPFVIVIGGVLLVATLAVVGARLWARCKIRRNAGLDDWLILATIPLLLVYDACHALGFFSYGVDRHAWEVTITQAVGIRIITWCIAVGYMLITSMVKISILMFYRRLSEGSVTKSWIWTVRAFIAFVILYAVVFTLMLFVDCRPLHAFWNKMDPEWALTNNYTCFNEGADFIASAIVSVITDAAVCVLPLLVVRRLQMPRKQKWALSALFGVGFFLCLCGIMRVVYMYNIYYTTYDTTWAAATVWSWTLVETHFAIICASAPALKLFFRRFLQSTHGQSYTTRQRQDYNNFGSSAELGAMGASAGGDGRRAKDLEGGEGGIYMADMLREGFASTNGSKSPVSVTVTDAESAEDDGLADVVAGIDMRTMEERSTKSIVRSRGSTDSILETR